MSDDVVGETTMADRYASRFAADLASNASQQDDLRLQIADLNERLGGLEREREWLTSARGTLPTARAGAPDATTPGEAAGPPPAQAAGPAVVAPARGTKKAATATKSGGRAAKPPKAPGARRVPAPPASATEAGGVPEQKRGVGAAKGGRGQVLPLHGLLRALLAGHGEPRKVSEVVSELEQAHPERQASVPAVRQALEGLVAKGELQRNRQNRTVFYTASTPAVPVRDAGTRAADQPVERVPTDT